MPAGLAVVAERLVTPERCVPEGPEIRRAADRIERAIGGETVQVEVYVPALSEWSSELSGRVVERIETRGKAMLTRFSGGLVLYTHNQLYGRWYVVRSGTTPRTRRSLRVAIRGARASALLFSATDIAVLYEDDLATHPFLARIGPDALSIDARQVRARLRDPRFRKRQLAALLLDQSFVAGLGNYLRAEILFVARVDPQQRAVDLPAPVLTRLSRALVDVTRRSYESGGITLDPRRERSLREAGESRRARRHFVYGRAGRACRVCATPIVRSELGGRGLYACPTCQPAP